MHRSTGKPLREIQQIQICECNHTMGEHVFDATGPMSRRGALNCWRKGCKCKEFHGRGQPPRESKKTKSKK